MACKIGALRGEAMTTVSVIIPTRDRAQQAEACMRQYRLTTAGCCVEIIAVIEADDHVSAAVLAGVADKVLRYSGPRSALAAWNLGASDAAGDVLVLGADDTWPHDGWLDAALAALATLPDGDGLVGFNDGTRTDGATFAGHFMVSRQFAIDHLGGVLLPPVYHHYYCDQEACQRAQRAGRYAYSAGALVEHRHPDFGKAERDAIYQYAAPFMAEDRALYLQRQAAGFPDDFPPVLGTRRQPQAVIAAVPPATGGISIGIPTTDRSAPWAMVESLLFLQTPGRGYTLRREGPLPVDVARNLIVEGFLASHDEWLLFLDADAVVHPGTLLRLLSWQQPVVSALTFARYGPLPPTVWRGEDPARPGYFITQGDVLRDWLGRYPVMQQSAPVLLDPRPDDALTPVDRTGCHCLLVHRDVMLALTPPWFVGKPPRGNQEDFYFCQQVQALGCPIYVDRSVVAAHLYGDRPIGALDWLVWDRVSNYQATGG
jgi:hypothetical protein